MTVEAFPGSKSGRVFFSPSADGSASLIIRDLGEDGKYISLSISGLQPLPEGSQYFLEFDSTPVKSDVVDSGGQG